MGQIDSGSHSELINKCKIQVPLSKTAHAYNIQITKL